jgi:carbamoyl-phosphate synthase large subunit
MRRRSTSELPAHLGRVLVTGAGGPAAVTVLRSLGEHADLIAADIDPFAVGLYLVPPERRVLLPRGDDPAFVDVLLHCAAEFQADLVIPTVDAELGKVSAARDRFAAHGIDLLVENVETLDVCLDKLALVRHCEAAGVPVPATLVFDYESTGDDFAQLGRQFIVKPRHGSGGRGFAVAHDVADLHGVPRDGSYIAQQLLPGAEFSIDVLGSPDGRVVAAVPRRRDKVDSGIAVAGRTFRDDALEDFGRAVAAAIGVTGVVNVQAKLDEADEPRLLEVNARFPGTMSLTQAAGIDMPLLAAAARCGYVLPDRIPFREIAVVRHWDDVEVPIDEYAEIPTAASPRVTS